MTGPEQIKVHVTFDYHPEEPDRSDATGMTEHEHTKLGNALAELGAENIRIYREGEA